MLQPKAPVFRGGEAISLLQYGHWLVVLASVDSLTPVHTQAALMDSVGDTKKERGACWEGWGIIKE